MTTAYLRLATGTALLLSMLLGACASNDEWPSRNGTLSARTVADADAGRVLIMENGCGACHMIPGISEADALAAPPLIGWSQRKLIAGAIPNTWENTVQWVKAPHTIEPDTAMPNVGLSRIEAEKVADYLFTLVRDEGGLAGFAQRLGSPFQ